MQLKMLYCGHLQICTPVPLVSHYIRSAFELNPSYKTESRNKAVGDHALTFCVASCLPRGQYSPQNIKQNCAQDWPEHTIHGETPKRLTGDAGVELVDPAGGRLSHSLQMYMDMQASGD